MRQAAGVALTTSAMFLVMVALLLNSAALFYMSTAILATIGVSRYQAYRSVRDLRFERHAPDAVKAGELVKVEITIWSDRRIRRPLIVAQDLLPRRMEYIDRTSSLPIAPAFDVPFSTQYTFRPLRRGVYRWSGLKVRGTDVLGFATTEKTYETSPVEVMVLPNPMPIEFEIPPAPAFGISDSEAGQGRGAGIEPRGVREYTSGDSLRYVHWRSSARANKLLVKEFATGSYAATSFVIQRTVGTDVGRGAVTSLEQICANAAFMAENMLRQGADVSFPTLGSSIRSSSFAENDRKLLSLLASVEANSHRSIAEEMEQARNSMPAGGLIYVFLTVADPGLVQQIRYCLATGIQVVAMIYDAEQFMGQSVSKNVHTAADPNYVEGLRSAGARVQLVRRPEAVM